MTTPRVTAGLEAATQELTGLDLGDARLEARAARVVTALARDPAATFPAAMATEAEREATYRWLRNRRVTLAALLAPHVAQTVARATATGTRPLVLLDRTAFIFAGEGTREGLTRRGPARHGLDAIVALAVTPTRTPLGVLQILPLPKAGGATDAATWDAAVTATDAHVAALAPIYVIDREAGAYALFSALQRAGRDFVIRVNPDRLGREHPDTAPATVRAIGAQAPVVLTRTVPLARRTAVGVPRETRRHHPPRPERHATLTVADVSDPPGPAEAQPALRSRDARPADRPR